MPGVGVRTAARILLYVGEASQFPTAGHLAAYAGFVSVFVTQNAFAGANDDRSVAVFKSLDLVFSLINPATRA